MGFADRPEDGPECPPASEDLWRAAVRWVLTGRGRETVVAVATERATEDEPPELEHAPRTASTAPLIRARAVRRLHTQNKLIDRSEV